MKFVVITHTPHFLTGEKYYAYGPYVREMNLWIQHTDSVTVVAPISDNDISNIHLAYEHNQLNIASIPSISLISFFEIIKSIVYTPVIVHRIWKAMKSADHIHLRCPGNIGLLGSLVQVFFPKKKKTAKYAGNWKPGAKQPLSYRFQKWILSNTFLTRKMQVLVYGEWEGQTKNIKPFFTASYRSSKKEEVVVKRFVSPFQFLFVGNLSPGKRPLYVIQLIEKLLEEGISSYLDIYGDGVEKSNLETYISENGLSEKVLLHGNQKQKTIEEAYKKSHFLVLPSRSEGWPKVVAEAMFWNVIPIVSKVSCVPWMLAQGERGILLEMDIEKDIRSIRSLSETNNEGITDMADKGRQWSQQYTLDSFENEIKQLI